MFASGQQLSQDPLHPFEVRDLRVDLREPVGGDLSDGAAIGSILEQQQLPDLLERETELLSPLDEADALDKARGVVPKCPGARWHRQELSVLVVANGLDADVGRTGEPSDRQ